ncbi:gag-pol polyprotein [Tanacetum coccineum]
MVNPCISYYSRFYKMMNELVRNQCHVTNHQVNVQFLLQLQPEWQRFVTLVKQSQELKIVSYHKLYDILKQHQNEVNEIRAERLARTVIHLHLLLNNNQFYPHQNLLLKSLNILHSLIATVYQKQWKSNCYSSAPSYDPETLLTVTEMNEMSKEKENCTPVVQKSGIQCYNCKEYGHVSRECQKPKRVKDAAYHKEKMLLCKQEEAGVQLNAEQADWKDDTDDESEEQELEELYVQNNNDNYNVFAMENEHPEQPESSNDIYLAEQGDTNITIDSLDICYDRTQDDQDETDDLDQDVSGLFL